MNMEGAPPVIDEERMKRGQDCSWEDVFPQSMRKNTAASAKAEATVFFLLREELFDSTSFQCVNQLFRVLPK